MNENFNLSPEGVKLIKHFEGCLVRNSDGTFRAYLCPADVLTIGWGHTNHHGRRFNASSRWTQAECDGAFSEDMQGFEEAVKRLVKVPLSLHQFDALVSFSYNCGSGALEKSTLLRKLNRGDYEGAANEFSKWVRGGGVVLKGLVRRRAAEVMLFQDGHSEAVHTLAKSNNEGMPQQVDAPVQPKSMATSKTGGAAVVIGGATVAAQVVDKAPVQPATDVAALGLHAPDLATTLAALLTVNTVMMAAVILLCAFIWYDRRRKLVEDQV